MSRLLEALRNTSSILERNGERVMSEELKALARKICNGENEKDVARVTLKLFSGTGSLNDIVIQEDGQVKYEADKEFEDCRKKLYYEIVRLF